MPTLPVLALLFACGPASPPTPEADMPADPAAAPRSEEVAPERTGESPGEPLLPTPFTLEQMKAGWVPGVHVRFRLEVAGQPTTLHDWEVLSNPDAHRVETAFTVLAENGTDVLVERTPRVSTYEELRQHAAFPASRTESEQATIDTPRGPLPGRRYRVTDASDKTSVQTYEFADAMPGPPVRVETRLGSEIVQTMVMLSRTDPGGEKGAQP